MKRALLPLTVVFCLIVSAAGIALWYQAEQTRRAVETERRQAYLNKLVAQAVDDFEKRHGVALTYLAGEPKAHSDVKLREKAAREALAAWQSVKELAADEPELLHPDLAKRMLDVDTTFAIGDWDEFWRVRRDLQRKAAEEAKKQLAAARERAKKEEDDLRDRSAKAAADAAAKFKLIQEKNKAITDGLQQTMKARAAVVRQNLNALFVDHDAKVDFGQLESTRTRVLPSGAASGHISFDFRYQWAKGAGKDVNAPHWKEMAVEFDLINGNWVLGDAITRRFENDRRDRPTQVLIDDADIHRILAHDAKEPVSKAINAWLDKAGNNSKQSKWDDAIADIDRAIEIEAVFSAPWNQRGVAHFRKGEWKQAIADYTKAIERRPGNSLYWKNRAHAHAKLAHWHKTIDDVSKAIELKNDDATAWQLRGSANAVLAQWQDASRDLAKACDLPKAPIKARTEYALVRLQLKDEDGYRQACKLLREHWAKDSNPKEAAQVAWTLSLSPGGPKVEDEIDALKKNDDYSSLRALGAALYRNGQPQQAIEAFMKGLKNRKQPAPTTWIFLAMAHHKLDEKAKANEWFQMANHWMETAKKDSTERPADVKGWRDVNWEEQIALEQTIREAERLLKPK